MFRNYFTIALRNLRKNRGYTIINMAGLAVGMCVCLLIGLYVEDELSFDRFHENADRIVTFTVRMGGDPMRSMPYPLASTLEAELPEVRHAVRTAGGGAVPVIHPPSQRRSDRTVLLADPAFFQVFSFPLVAGSAASVLQSSAAAVITESSARAFFGDQDPIGQPLQVKRYGSTYNLIVSGVVRDVPANSSLRFDIVAPLELLPEGARRPDSWRSYAYRTYALLHEGTRIEALAANMRSVLHPHYAESENPPSFDVLPMTSLYLSGFEQSGDIVGHRRYVYLFGSVAIFVLLIAAINYVNLVTAQSTRRAAEVGVRKTLGASRHQLVRQFLAESILTSLSAFFLAVALTFLALPTFGLLFEKTLTVDPVSHGWALAGLSAFVLMVGASAGVYPAFVLSGFAPVRVLRGAGASRVGDASRLRRCLVVFQFGISVVLLVGTSVIYRQLGFLQSKDLGFDGDQVVTVDLPDEGVWQRRAALAEQARRHPAVMRASVASGLPGSFNIRMGVSAKEVSPHVGEETEEFVYAPAVVDLEYMKTLGLRLKAGRGFSDEFPTDASRAYMLNETAAAALGWTPAEAVGKAVKFYDGEGPDGEIIGVVEDFHIASLHQPIEPVILHLREASSWSSSGVLVARLAADDLRAGMRHLEETMAAIAPDEPFTYAFLDEAFDEMYRTETRLAKIVSLFAGLAVFIACLGLFGLAAYAAETRTKELGIRKVLGASISNLVTLLSRDFIALVAVGFALAVPVAYLGMSRWLEDFAYRIELTWTIFLLAGVAALAVALVTVGYQAVRAAIMDPVKSLRYE